MDFQINNVDRMMILNMLVYEQKLRYSDQIQNLYDQNLNNHEDPEFVEKSVQRDALENCGFNTSERSIKNYQSIAYYYEDDEEIKQAIHYMRINIIKDCPIKVNQPYINSNLVTLDENPVQLSDYYNLSRPLIILAGSIT
jgi:hypothetical protein